jgi:hypothetical protein
MVINLILEPFLQKNDSNMNYFRKWFKIEVEPIPACGPYCSTAGRPVPFP